MRSLCAYELSDDVPVLDLDDAAAVTEWGLRPSQVVTPDRATTQGWAARIHNSRRFAGVRWWSFYNPDWGSLGLWDLREVTVVGVAYLTVDSEVVEDARRFLMRSWVR